MKYDHASIEKKWQTRWLESGVYEPDLNSAKKPFFNLMMFPYPSAEGLHVGNMYAFTGSDVYGRMKRMQGHDVFEPIGLDGFGIHSENYAMKIGAHPAAQAKVSEKNFYKQLAGIGNGFAWNERLETYDPAYYRFTQWIFTEMFRRGLAYRKKASVNWCTGCLTVLSDEQVIGAGDPATALKVGGGKCERCASEVVKKDLEQWFFKITDYAERLLKNLEGLDWSEKVKIAQKNWIGKSEGAIVPFKTKGSEDIIEVFTTRPDTLACITFLAVPAGDARAGKIALHPITGADVPIYATEYVLAEYGTGAVMGVPAHDERDRAFAEKNNIAIADLPMIDAAEAVKKAGGRFETRYRLRDWLISRQRYWGPPIPMIRCEKCGWQPVPAEDLPVILPQVKDFRPTGTGVSPLASMKDFYETECPKCGGAARRETDVSDTFLDSSWYYLAYLFLKTNPKDNLDSDALKAIFEKWTPVDMYIGGAEHSVLHLLYSRFVCMALHDWGVVGFDEPFAMFRAHGLLIKDGAKMSKSKGNVINPDEYVARFGADTLRMYLMFLAPFAQGGDFRDQAVLGIHRFLSRVWKLQEKISNTEALKANSSKLVARPMHQAIKKVTQDIEKLQYNTAISALMVYLNALEEKGASAEEYKVLLQLIAPFAPHIAEELWEKAGEAGSVHVSAWPAWDESCAAEDTAHIVVQVNGKKKAVISLSRGASQADAEGAVVALGQDIGQGAKRVIFVPDRLINFIAE